jgi:hypothetical protein
VQYNLLFKAVWIKMLNMDLKYSLMESNCLSHAVQSFVNRRRPGRMKSCLKWKAIEEMYFAVIYGKARPNRMEMQEKRWEIEAQEIKISTQKTLKILLRKKWIFKNTKFRKVLQRSNWRRKWNQAVVF